jgi:plasmid maintenance system antidote protein VapI
MHNSGMSLTWVKTHGYNGMSVKDAVERLGIGRPALSNFLNGKSKLSAKMAIRMDKSFDEDQNVYSIR